jgi:hypothetical protein
MITSDVLYLIRHKKTKTIKIGITSQWQSRAKTLRVGTDTELLALLQTPDVKETECELHHEFKQYRLPGSEYFAFNKRQVEVITTRLKEQFEDVTELFSLYDSVNKSNTLEVTGAVSWSGSEWFRLNHERRRRSPLNSAEIVLHKYPEKFDRKDLKVLEEQLALVIEKLKIVSYFGGIGLEQSIAAHIIWYSIIGASQFFIDKSLYRRHCNPSRVLHYLPRKISTADIECFIPDNIFLEDTNLKLESSTVNMIFAIAADCRLKEKLESAMNTSVKIEDFKYYLQDYGPRN